jgi:hypothetical protein
MGANVSAFSGVVKATAGVFSAATIVDADISGSAAIDATKLGLGNVDNTELSYLNGATSNIQNQINSITGAGITALTGDVTATGPGSAAATIANGAVTDAKVASGIDAAKIANGNVSNTEFQYLDGVTSLIQTQLDGKQPLDADLTAIAGLASTGLIARTGAGAAAVRTITGTTNLIDVTNGDGVSGNPTLTVGSSVVTLTGTQALTNKDYDGGTASNTSRLTLPKAAYATLAGLARKEGTLLYATDQDLVYADDGSNLIPVGSGSSGTGTLNIVDNPSATASTTGWTAATNYTVARNTTDSPLEGVIDTCFAISTTTASSESPTSGVYAAAQLMPAALRNTKTQVSFYVNVPATSLGVWRLSIYNASGTRMSLSSDSSSVTTLPGGFNGQFVCTFDADSSASYTLSLTQTTRSSANTLYFTNLVIGNGITAQGAAVSGSVTWTPTGSWVSNTTYTGDYTRVGSVGNFHVRISLSGPPTAAALTVNMPSGLTIDTSLVSVVVGTNTFGRAHANANGVPMVFSVVSTGSASTVQLYFQSTASSTSSAMTGVNNTVPVSWTSPSTIDLYWSVPIAEWSGNGTVNLGQGAQVEYAYNSSGITSAGASDTTAFAYGPGGAAIGSIASTTGANSVTTMRVRFQYPVQVSDQITLETDSGSSGARWTPFEQAGLANGLYQGTSVYGAYLRQVNSTDFDVSFGNKGSLSNNATYAGDGVAWSAVTAWRWRVRKSTASAPVGFGLATQTASGLVNNQVSLTELTAADLTSQTNCSIASGDVAAGRIKWSMVNNVVTLFLHIDTFTITGGVTSFSFTLPSSVPAPTFTMSLAAMIYDNSSSVITSGFATLSTARVMTFQKFSGATFTGGTDTNYLRAQMTWNTI